MDPVSDMKEASVPQEPTALARISGLHSVVFRNMKGAPALYTFAK